MKKNFIKPISQVVKIEKTSIIAASGEGGPGTCDEFVDPCVIVGE